MEIFARSLSDRSSFFSMSLRLGQSPKIAWSMHLINGTESVGRTKITHSEVRTLQLPLRLQTQMSGSRVPGAPELEQGRVLGQDYPTRKRRDRRGQGALGNTELT